MAIYTITTALMPLSQATAWYLVLSKKPLYKSVFGLSLFYCLWALYNRYLGGVTQELGHISMGLLALAAYFKHRYACVAANVLVFLNFAAVAYLILIQWDVKTLADKVKGDTTLRGLFWARVFKWYFASSIAFWGTTLYKFATLQETRYEGVPP